ncbi:MAG: chromate transporter [Clostridiales Family XIII bacterium]|jgi:chromate transporter|nr:chromate transporter [Clostridiales Family XIII bacterium]
MIYFQLFLSFFQIGLFSFGGGLAALPLIQSRLVDIRGWLTLAEFADIVTVSEMTPGPIAINAATFAGTKIAGLGGALAATLGCVLPSCIIVTLLAWLYDRYKESPAIRGALTGLRSTAAALIFSAGLSILILSFWGSGGFTLDGSSIDFTAVIMFAAGLFLLRKFKPNPIFILLGSGLLGAVCYLVEFTELFHKIGVGFYK